MEDEAAAAALAVEFIQSLDNLPHEVSHTFKEIEHKDTKVQELMHKIHNREVQLRNLLIKASAGAPQPPDILSDQDSAKVQKLGDKIRADYARADELSGQNEQLSIALWRSIFRHNQRLSDEMAKVSPTVISNVAAGLANSNAANAPSVLGLPAALASLRGPNGAYDPALLAAAAGIAQSQQMAAMLSSQSQTPQLAGQKRKAGGSGISSPATIPTPLSSSQSNPFSRVVSSNIPLGNFVGSNRSSGFGGIGIGGRPATPTFELPTGILSGGPLTPIDRPSSAGGGNNRNRKSNQNGGNNRIGMGGGGGNKGSSNLSRKKEEEFEEELEDGEEEKDETLYCTCQRVSFGEMIGCDSDDCKYEWFHIGCVGVSKPLPQTWYCPDCSAERRKRRK